MFEVNIIQIAPSKKFKKKQKFFFENVICNFYQQIFEIIRKSDLALMSLFKKKISLKKSFLHFII